MAQSGLLSADESDWVDPLPISLLRRNANPLTPPSPFLPPKIFPHTTVLLELKKG